MRDAHVVVEVVDPTTGIVGRLVIDRLVDGVATGGIRAAPVVSESLLRGLARDMTRKCALLRMRCGGAKAGIEVPAGVEVRPALERFLRAVGPYARDHCLLGSDLGTSADDVNAVIKALGHWPGRKALAEKLLATTIEEFLAVLAASLDGASVSVMRNGWGVEGAVRAVLERRLQLPIANASVAVQGFGKVGGGSALALARAGARITSVADVRGTISSRAAEGLPVGELWTSAVDGVVSRDRLPASAQIDPAHVVLADVDVLVLAAVEDSIPPDLVDRVRARAIVAGANRAVDAATSRRLEQRGIVVVPSLVGSLGTLNSLGVTTSPEQVRDRIVETIRAVTCDVLARGQAEGLPLDRAAEALALERYAEIETA